MSYGWIKVDICLWWKPSPIQVVCRRLVNNPCNSGNLSFSKQVYRDAIRMELSAAQFLYSEPELFDFWATFLIAFQEGQEVLNSCQISS